MKNVSLTSKRRERLERQLKQAKDARVFRRTLAVLEYGDGIPVSQIAHQLKVDRRSVSRWIEAYRASYDPTALGDEERPGRPPRWTDGCSAWLQAVLDASPEEVGFLAANWTVPLLQEHLEHCLGEWYSDDTIRRALRRLGYVWKRTRYVLAPDPEREKKTPDPQKSAEFEAAQRPPGRGRDRSFAVSSPAVRVGPTRRSDPSSHFGTQCASGDLRGHASPHRQATVPDAEKANPAGLPGVFATDPFALPRLACRVAPR